MKMKKLIILSLMICTCLSTEAKSGTNRNAYDKKDFKSYFYVDAMGGVNWTLGECKWTDLFSPSVSVGAGWRFSPYLGVRLSAVGWEQKGGWSSPEAKYKWNYVSPSLELEVDILNAINGYNPARTINLLAFIGGQAAFCWGNDDAKALADRYNLEYLWDHGCFPGGHAGLRAMFKVSDLIDIMVDGTVNCMSDHFNSKNNSNADWNITAMAGLRFNIGRTKPRMRRPVEYRTKEIIKREIIRDTITNYIDNTETIERDTFERKIFFNLNSYEILDSEKGKLNEVRQHYDLFPDANIVVCGYADKGTGDDKINDHLAANRATEVISYLTSNLGIPRNNISYDSRGARVQPMSENDKNRMVSILVIREIQEKKAESTTETISSRTF